MRIESLICRCRLQLAAGDMPDGMWFGPAGLGATTFADFEPGVVFKCHACESVFEKWGDGSWSAPDPLRRRDHAEVLWSMQTDT